MPYPGASSSAMCYACAAGAYSSLAAATSTLTCNACAAGTYAAQAGASTCVACAIGAYSKVAAASTSTVCTACGLGSFATATYPLAFNGTNGTQYALVSTNPGATFVDALNAIGPSLIWAPGVGGRPFTITGWPLSTATKALQGSEDIGSFTSFMVNSTGGYIGAYFSNGLASPGCSIYPEGRKTILVFRCGATDSVVGNVYEQSLGICVSHLL